MCFSPCLDSLGAFSINHLPIHPIILRTRVSLDSIGWPKNTHIVSIKRCVFSTRSIHQIDQLASSRPSTITLFAFEIAYHAFRSLFFPFGFRINFSENEWRANKYFKDYRLRFHRRLGITVQIFAHERN